MTAARRAAVHAVLDRCNLDGVIVVDQWNRRRLAGYSAADHAPDESAGVLLIDRSSATLFTSPNNTGWAASESPGVDVLPWKAPWTTTIAEHIEKTGWRRVGFEERAMTVAVHLALLKTVAVTISLHPLGRELDRLRLVKDEHEIAAFKAAIAMTDRVYEIARAQAVAGMTERQFAWIVDRTMRELGADGPAFSTSVASGPHAARPHHAGTDRPFQEGEPITVDLGVCLNGYNGDLTRAFWLGEPDDRLVSVYNVVHAAQARALAGLRAGITGKQGDALARDHLTAAGFEREFLHGLGHGLGLRVHEAPSLGPASTDVLESGSVVTVEPGVYIPGWGGVRIEDVVVIEANGCRNLTRAPK